MLDKRAKILFWLKESLSIRHDNCLRNMGYMKVIQPKILRFMLSLSPDKAHKFYMKAFNEKLIADKRKG